MNLVPIFDVTITRKVESHVRVRAVDSDQAKALAYSRMPHDIDDWHCDVFKGTTFRVKEVEE